MLAVSNIQSPAAGNDTILVINRIGGNATTGMSRLGSIFGLLLTIRKDRQASPLPAKLPAGQVSWQHISEGCTPL
jgi:hypothetical protein